MNRYLKNHLSQQTSYVTEIKAIEDEKIVSAADHFLVSSKIVGEIIGGS